MKDNNNKFGQAGQHKADHKAQAQHAQQSDKNSKHVAGQHVNGAAKSAASKEQNASKAGAESAKK